MYATRFWENISDAVPLFVEARVDELRQFSMAVTSQVCSDFDQLPHFRADFDTSRRQQTNEGAQASAESRLQLDVTSWKHAHFCCFI